VVKGSLTQKSSSRNICQFLNVISFEDVYGKTMFSPKNLLLVDDHELIKKDYHKLKEFSVMTEIIDKCVSDHDNHKSIYELVKSSLSNIDFGYLRFCLKMIYLLGYNLNLVPDGRVIIGYNIESSKLVYEDEKSNIDFSTKEIKLILDVITNKEIQLKDNEVLIVKNFIKKYYQYHIDLNLKNI